VIFNIFVFIYFSTVALVFTFTFILICCPCVFIQIFIVLVLTLAEGAMVERLPLASATLAFISQQQDIPNMNYVDI
jgi:hypothetical protein